MQQAGKTVEIGYLCFEMNIKDGRGFPGISLHNPIKWSACLVRISRETNKKQLGRGQCCGQSEEGDMEGWPGAGVWGNVNGERNREMIVRRNEWSEAEWIVCAMKIEIQLCDSNWESQKLNYHVFDTGTLQAFLCLHSQDECFLCTVHHFFLSLSWQDEVRQHSALSLASSPSLSDSLLAEDNTL